MPVKTVEQQALQALHRVRTQWQTARVARINAMRGLLREHGHAIPVGARTVLRRVTAILEDADADRARVLRQTMALVVDEVRALEEKSPASIASSPVGRRAPGGDAAANDSWRRRAHRDRLGWRRRTYSCISSRTRICQLAGVDPA